MSRALAASLLVASALSAQDSLFSHLRLGQEGRASKGGHAKEAIPFSMDQTLQLRWDQGGLRTRFLGPTDPAQARRLADLTQAIPLAVALQGDLMALKRGDQTSSARMKATAVPLKPLLDTLAPKGTPLRDRMNTAILANDFTPLIETLSGELSSTRALLQQAQAPGPQAPGWRFMVSADLVDAGGHAHPLHLPGYDAISEGSPHSFGRFQLIPDERAEREAHAAAAWAPLANAAFQGQLRAELKARLDRIRALLHDRGAALEAGLRAAENHLRDATGAEAVAFTQELEGLRVQARPLLEGLGDPPATLDQVPTWIAGLQQQLAALQANVRGLPARLKEAVARIDRVLLAESATLRAQLKGDLEPLVSAWDGLESWWKTQVQAPLDALAADASPVGTLGEEAEAATRQARDLMGGSLDTSLDLVRARVPAYPGDEVHLMATLSRKRVADGAWEEVASDRQALAVEKYGFYTETRGGLLFVQPRTAGTREGSFMAVPALLFQARWGFEGAAPWVNQGVIPGLGLSFSLLDLDDKKDTELGVALNLSFFKNLLWIGYGRDLQAKANYAYLGLNPLVFYQLAKGR